MSPRASEIHRFPPNTGRTVGYLGLGLALGVIVVGFFYIPLRPWVILSLGSVAAGIAVWIVLLRPRAYATSEDLVLLNMVTDSWIPLAAIERVEPKYALIIWAHGRKHHCVGIAKSRRAATAGLRSRVQSGNSSIFSRAGWMQPQSDTGEKIVYENFVAERIEDLAKNARARGLEPGPVRRRPATLEIGLLVVSLAVFAAAFFV
jgi:hypothetical protein